MKHYKLNLKRFNYIVHLHETLSGTHPVTTEAFEWHLYRFSNAAGGVLVVVVVVVDKAYELHALG